MPSSAKVWARRSSSSETKLKHLTAKMVSSYHLLSLCWRRGSFISRRLWHDINWDKREVRLNVKLPIPCHWILHFNHRRSENRLSHQSSGISYLCSTGRVNHGRLQKSTKMLDIRAQLKILFPPPDFHVPPPCWDWRVTSESQLVISLLL